MSYVVLARKYRPQTFEDVVGQTPVSQTLRNALRSGRLAHAYVFSGPRGIGKTTTARILAKCLNCQKGPTMTPCNTCPPCVSITSGNSVEDVLEIDGASNRGIEQIRELRESAKYTPSSSRYRIYIIDEAHQITKDAFGALLKILEEPPAHVIFMMATTEVQKIPSPILSRCQRFSLRPIPSDQVLKHLGEICQKEKVKVDKGALADIVRFVEGSMRDALSLLDQAIVYAPDGVTSETLRELLGLLPQETIQKMARVIRSSEPAEILKAASAAIRDGIDLTQLGKDLQSYYHSLLLAKAGVTDSLGPNATELQTEAKNFEYSELERNIRLLGRMLDEMRRSESPRAVFEVYALKIGQRLMDPRQIIEKLNGLKSMGGAAMPSSPAFSTNSPSKANESRPTSFSPKHTPPTSGPAQRKPSPKMENTSGTAVLERPAKQEPKSTVIQNPATLDDLMDAWKHLQESILEEKQTLGWALDEAHLNLDGNTLNITFSKKFNHQMAERHAGYLRERVQKDLNPSWALAFHHIPKDEPDEPKVHTPAPEPPPAHLHARHPEHEPDDQFEDVAPDTVDENVKNALKHFPGTLHREKKS